MTRIIRFGAAALAAVLVLGMAAAASAQEKPKAQIPLKLQLVLARYQGEKKISSVPYVLWLTTNESRTSLRMGSQIPVPAGGINFNLRDVGTNIDCTATTAVEDGVYKLNLTVSDLAVSNAEGPRPAGDSMPPVFRTFTSTFNILLRNGQTAQYTSATDPVSGEVLKIDATLNVLK